MAPGRCFSHTRCLLAGLLLLAILCSCISPQHFKPAQDALDTFHQRLRAHEFEKILKDATPEFRRSMGGDAGRVFFSRVSDTLGAPVSSNPIGVRENHMPAGVFIQASYNTHFEKGDAQENFTWRVDAGTLHLAGYQINSPLFLTH
jgi:hypothetical protein